MVFIEYLSAVLSSFVAALPGAVAQGLIWGIMAIGVYITYKVLDVADLTVDGTMCTGGAVCVMMMINGYNVWVSLIVATIAGLLCGLLTGIFHVVMGIPAILAGILSQLALYSVNLKIIGSSNQVISAVKYKVLVAIRYLEGVAFYKNPIFVGAMFVIAIIAVLYWFFGTALGCSLRATGSNQNMSRAQGINTKRNVVLGLMISNGLVALSSALYSQYQGFTDVNMGRGAIVIGLAAVIIGNVCFDKIFRNFALKLLGVAIGSVIYYVVLTLVIAFGFDTELLKLLQALIVAVFLAFPYWKRTFLPVIKSLNKRGKIRRNNRKIFKARRLEEKAKKNSKGKSNRKEVA